MRSACNVLYMFSASAISLFLTYQGDILLTGYTLYVSVLCLLDSTALR